MQIIIIGFLIAFLACNELSEASSVDDSLQFNLENLMKSVDDKIKNSLSPLGTKAKPKAVQSEKFQQIGSKYYYIEEQDLVNWFTAVHRCHEMGSHLASLQNEAEFNSLKAKLNVNRNYWIDITDLANEGEYISHTTGLKAPYLNWYPSYNPDNKGGNEHCVHLWNIEKTLRMNDAPCALLRNFVCVI